MGKAVGGNRKSSRYEQRAPEQRVEKMNCLFCGREFDVNQLVFAIKTDRTDVLTDKVYERHLTENFQLNGKTTKRRMKFIHEWQEQDVQKREANGIPLIVKGTFYPPKNESIAVDGTGRDELGLESERFDDLGKVITSTATGDKGEDGVSTHRLCPHCHCELPEGVGVYREVRIGLYGGKRSGKTTYMAMAVKYMEESLNALGLASAVLMEESRDVLNSLYRGASDHRGLSATNKGVPPFPIGMTIAPRSDKYPPFFLIFQDVPGEAAVKGEDMLINHPFTRVTDFLGVVDANMFVLTPEQAKLHECDEQIKTLGEKLEDLLSGKARATDPELQAKLDGEYKALYAEREAVQRERDRIDTTICRLSYNDIFGAPKFAEYMKTLHSVQLMLVKMDQWLDARPTEQKELIYCSELISDHTHDHQKQISARHLYFADVQMRSLIKLFPAANLTDPNGNTILEWAAESLKLKAEHRDKIAFTAIASRQNLNAHINGTYEDCMNILDPILNICRWEKLLPVKQM